MAARYAQPVPEEGLSPRSARKELDSWNNSRQARHKNRDARRKNRDSATVAALVASQKASLREEKAVAQAKREQMQGLLRSAWKLQAARKKRYVEPWDVTRKVTYVPA